MTICPRLDLDIYFFTDDSLNGDNFFENKDIILHLKKYYKGSEKFLKDYVNNKISSNSKLLWKRMETKRYFKAIE